MSSRTGKAGVLATLADARSGRFLIDPFLVVDWTDWTRSQDSVLQEINDQWGDGTALAVRSSFPQEGYQPALVAGRYVSQLGIPAANSACLKAAIDGVFASYCDGEDPGPGSGATGCVLVQEQVSDVDIAGVVTTRDAENRPYFVIEFDRGDTTTVTSGQAHNRVRIAHSARSMPSCYRAVVDAATAASSILEEQDLVIEFAVDRSGEVHIFQAWARRREPLRLVDAAFATRLKAVEAEVQRVLNETPTALSDMADWNPAEILGPDPAALDISLYEFLISNDVWSKARAAHGYHDVGPRPLLRMVGGKPYVDICLSFASLTPAALAPVLRERLVEDRMRWLKRNPTLHDKVEFEVLVTVVCLGGREELRRRLGHTLDEADIAQLDCALRDLTATDLADGRSLLNTAREAAYSLWSSRAGTAGERRFSSSADFGAEILRRLKLCRVLGTLPFARVARLAFMLRDLLGQLVAMEAIEQSWLDRLQRSVTTPASVFAAALSGARAEDARVADLAALFGHLRPRTYDITSTRYTDDLDLLLAGESDSTSGLNEKQPKPDFNATAAVIALRRAGLPDVDFPGLCRSATSEREWLKFTFTAVVSDVLEDLALLGTRFGLEREEVRHLTLHELISAASQPPTERVARLSELVANRRRDRETRVALPHLMFSPGDLYFTEEAKPSPTYVTNKRLVAELCRIDSPATMVRGRIGLIEAADPGYDWIFAAGIRGLITRYGGSASHMAIRCEELGLPAAIGIGDRIFEALDRAEVIELDCRRGVTAVIQGRRERPSGAIQGA